MDGTQNRGVPEFWPSLFSDFPRVRDQEGLGPQGIMLSRPVLTRDEELQPKKGGGKPLLPAHSRYVAGLPALREGPELFFVPSWGLGGS